MANEFDWFKCPLCLTGNPHVEEIRVADFPQHVEDEHGEILTQAEEEYPEEYDGQWDDLILLGDEEDIE